MTLQLPFLTASENEMYFRHVKRAAICNAVFCGISIAIVGGGYEVIERTIAQNKAAIVNFLETLNSANPNQYFADILRHKGKAPQAFAHAVLTEPLTILTVPPLTAPGVGTLLMGLLKNSVRSFLEWLLLEGAMMSLCCIMNQLTKSESMGKYFTLEAAHFEGSFHHLYNFSLSSTMYFRLLPVPLLRMCNQQMMVADVLPKMDLIEQQKSCTASDLALWQFFLTLPPTIKAVWRLMKWASSGGKKAGLPLGAAFASKPKFQALRKNLVAALGVEMIGVGWSTLLAYGSAKLGEKMPEFFLTSVFCAILDRRRGTGYVWSSWALAFLGA